jgi:hypothetical protein
MSQYFIKYFKFIRLEKNLLNNYYVPICSIFQSRLGQFQSVILDSQRFMQIAYLARYLFDFVLRLKWHKREQMYV